MLQNNSLAMLLIVLCCGCDGNLNANNQCLALLLIVLCCGGCQGGSAFGGEKIG